MAERRWQRIDRVNAFNHRELRESDVCVFLYTREKHGYGEIGSWSHPYQVIENFKMKPEVKESNPKRWRYKECAIDEIAHDLAGLFDELNPLRSYALVPAVTSKSKTDSDYDNRLVVVCERVAAMLPNVECCDILSMDETVEAAHSGAGSRNVEEITRHIVVNAETEINDRDIVCVFDDVITTGAHFKACEKAITEAYPDAKVFGAFWARTASWDESE